MNKILVGVICILSCACNQDKNTATYFGGGIVHPKDDYVILTQQNLIIDSIPVDQNGHFSHYFNLEKSGLFTFRHGYEYQLIFLEPQDSLRLRLNTLEFDESLVFAGKGAVENNFLIENYLLNQKNSDLILSYYKISPEEFQFKTDSIKAYREVKLKSLQDKHDLSDKFIDLAQKSIDYEFYDMRERYAFLLYKYNSSKAETIPDNFFDYRKNIDFSDEVALNLIGYQRFLDNYLKNKSIKICKQNKKAKDCYNLNSYSNIDDRIYLVDSLIKDKHLRQRYFERFIQEEIIYAKTPKHIEHTLELIEEFDFTETKKEHLKLLVEFQNTLIAGADLKQVKIQSKDFITHNLEDVMGDKLAIIYSWSVQSPSHHELRIKKIKKLKEAYPDIQFIGINIDYNTPDQWLDAVSKYNYNIDNEYIIEPEEHADFYRSYLNKVFFLDKDSIIRKSEIVLDNADFNKHIEDFIASQK